MKITPVILCGGSGTRLWPISRKSLPKQFVPLVENKSLLELTIDRLSNLIVNSDNEEKSCHRIICVASEAHRFLVLDAFEASKLAQGPGTDKVDKTILLEPIARNTAAAMALAALFIKKTTSQDELVLFCPADHFIPDTEEFINCVRGGIQAALTGAIVTFGVTPTFPSTAYGYIEQGVERKDGSRSVKRFIEKPNAQKAQELLLQAGVYWNSGIFLISVKTLLQALKVHAADILESCSSAMSASTNELRLTNQPNIGNKMMVNFIRPSHEEFKSCRSESFDYAVMEQFDQISIVPFNGQWSDVGSWNAIANLTPPDADGNRLEGKGIAINAHNTFIYARDRTVVALGTQNLLIIETADAVLVLKQDFAENVKEVVNLLEKQYLTEASTHRKVARPWGWYDNIDFGDKFKVKRIGVKPGASLSLQIHQHRAEHWIVVSGTAEVTRGSETYLLSENQSTYIPVGEIHRLRNPGKFYLEMIEIQTGTYLNEDDIVRLEDTYGRTSEK